MQKLTFTTNWNNKLNCDNFTTLRLSGRLNVGDLVEVVDRGVSKGMYKILDRRRLENIEKINDWMARLDTGYPAEETKAIIKRMYKDIKDWDRQPIYYYLVGRPKKAAK